MYVSNVKGGGGGKTTTALEPWVYLIVNLFIFGDKSFNLLKADSLCRDKCLTEIK